MTHERKVLNLFEFISMIGGISGAFYTVIGSISQILGYYLFLGYLIKRTFENQKYKKEETSFRQNRQHNTRISFNLCNDS